MAGDDETGVSIIRLVEAARRRARRRPGARSRSGRRTTPGPSTSEPRRSPCTLLDPLPERFEPQREEGATYAEKIAPADRLLDLSARRRSSSGAYARSRRTSAPGRAGGPPRHRLARPRCRRRLVRAARGAAGGRPTHGLRRLAPRPALMARRRPRGGPRTRSSCASSSRTPTPIARSRPPPRPSTPATARSPSRSPTAPCSASARSTTASSARAAAGREARPAGPGGAAHRRLPARLPRPASRGTRR